MKIAVLGCVDNVYHDGVRIANAFVRKGHTTCIYSLADDPQNVIKEIKKFAPDFCIVTIGRGYSVEALKELQKITFLVHWSYDEMTPQEDHLYNDVKNIYDLTFVKSKGLIPLLKDYCKDVVWMPMYYDQYFDTVPTINTQKQFDVLFAGEPHPAQSTIRQDYLTRLCEDNFNVHIVGFYWNDFKSKIPAKYLGGAIGPQLSRLLASTKIALNFKNNHLQQLELGFSDRVMKVMGAGCFCLTHEILGIEKMFTLGVHLDTYKDYNDMIDKIGYYLQNDEKRAHIATMGQTKILTEYNIDIVTNKYLEEIKKRL